VNTQALSKFNFSPKALLALPAPNAGRAHYYDGKAHGLELIKTKNGTATFYTFRWMKEKNRPVRVLIGRFPEISLLEARKKNAENVELIARGIDPNEAKRAKAAEPTLGSFWDFLLENFYKADRSPATCLDYSRTFNKHLADWRHKKLSEITRADIEALKERIAGCSGPQAANNTLRLLSAIFGKAAEEQFRGANPCQGVPLFPGKKRDRVPAGDEIPRLFQAIKEEANSTARDILLLLIYTGQRKSDVCAMKWSDINLAAKEWCFNLPKGVQRVPLIPEAVKVLKERMGDSSPWVFPSKAGASGHFKNLKKVWARVLARSGVKDLRIHDLRRFYGRMLVQSGAPLSVVQRALGHRSYQSVQAYARFNPDPVRSAVMAATQAIFKAGGKEELGRVVGSISPKGGFRD